MKDNSNQGNVDLFGSLNIHNWYKKWWLWLIIIIPIICGAFMLSYSPYHSSNRAFNRTYSVKQNIDDNGLKIRVNNVKYSRGNNIDNLNNNQRFVIANITITNNSRKNQKYNEFDFDLNSNGVTRNWDATKDHQEHELYSGSLDKGSKVNGNLFGKVQENSKNQLRWHPHFSHKAIKVDLNS